MERLQFQQIIYSHEKLKYSKIDLNSVDASTTLELLGSRSLRGMVEGLPKQLKVVIVSAALKWS